ncbi:hypothetical protein [Acidiphilium acidophilum]|uniref:Helix-turn-helix domain-containing protein n=1 Tax=Acidiphilium acidophilum TaxID=76588 RepID=A0AAW9DR08_ACIAO|nr:hypothetical protein [Acidiphilium acidophilum]MDX5931571.1 hypothetical protein [Acidiphilium acidophilum]
MSTAPLQVNTAIYQQPITATIKGVRELTGWTHSECYRRLAAGDIKAVKQGRRTYVIVSSVREYLENRPVATFNRKTA